MSSGPATGGAMNLAELQRAMAAAVMMPLTADEDMRSQDAHGRPMAEVAAGFIAPNSRLTPFERLEIYNRQDWYRVLGALAEDFPALRMVLGATVFEALSIAYLQAHPSRSFSLRNLGSKLVEWLAEHPEAAGRRHKLAVDVAKIEWAFVEAFDNLELPPLKMRQIAGIDGDSQLGLQPHLRLIALDHAADDLVLSLHQGQKSGVGVREAGVKHEDVPDADNDPAKPARLTGLKRRPTWLAAHRVDNIVYYRRLEREEFRTLTALGEGRTLGEALMAGLEGSRKAAAKRPAMVQGWFGTWAELGWICDAGNRG
jgi:hypothetical protein